jgi:hypothetical protein
MTDDIAKTAVESNNTILTSDYQDAFKGGIFDIPSWPDRYDEFIDPAWQPYTLPNINIPPMAPSPTTLTPDPLKRQVNGDHYKTMAIQPIEYILANDLGWCEGNIVKYATRWHQKGGVADIEKIIHYAEILLAEAKKKLGKN